MLLFAFKLKTLILWDMISVTRVPAEQALKQLSQGTPDTVVKELKIITNTVVSEIVAVLVTKL